MYTRVHTRPCVCPVCKAWVCARVYRSPARLQPCVHVHTKAQCQRQPLVCMARYNSIPVTCMHTYTYADVTYISAYTERRLYLYTRGGRQGRNECACCSPRETELMRRTSELQDNAGTRTAPEMPREPGWS